MNNLVVDTVENGSAPAVSVYWFGHGVVMDVAGNVGHADGKGNSHCNVHLTTTCVTLGLPRLTHYKTVNSIIYGAECDNQRMWRNVGCRQSPLEIAQEISGLTTGYNTLMGPHI